MKINRLKELRTKKKIDQKTLVKKLGLDSIKDVIDIEENIEGNLLQTSDDVEDKILKYFKIEKKDLYDNDANKNYNIDDLKKRNSSYKKKYLFLDTSILIKNYRILEKYFNYFDKICVTKVVSIELETIKNRNTEMLHHSARLAIAQIGTYIDKIETGVFKEEGHNSDEKTFNAALSFAKEHSNSLVVLLSKDGDFKLKKSTLDNFLNLNEKEYEEKIEEKEVNYSQEETKKFWDLAKENEFEKLNDINYAIVNFNLHENSYSPLCYLLEKKQAKLVDNILYKYGNLINLDIVGSEPHGYAALHVAVMINSLSTVKNLIKYNANINIRSLDVKERNVTPLMIAASRNYKDIVNLLLEHDVSVNQQDSNGETALHKAAKKKSNIYHILKKRSDENILCNNYKKAEYYFNEKKN